MIAIQLLRKRLAGQTVRQVGHNDAGELPRFVQVIKTEENRVCHPIVLTKNPLHLGQKHAVPEKFLAQEIVEDMADQGNSQEPPWPRNSGLTN